MRNILMVGWLLVPIAAWTYHEGPGQDRIALEQMDAVMVAAHDAAAAGNWRRAAEKYAEALTKLPREPDRIDARLPTRLRIELNKARMLSSELPTARDELGALVEELDADEKSDPALLADAREALARSQFYTTWLMRLEGVHRDEWGPEIEAARQNWRLLAERASQRTEVARLEQDLEAAIRLERLELEDLQGLPLPSE